MEVFLEKTVQIYPILDGNLEPSNIDDLEAAAIISELKRLNVSDSMYELIFVQIKSHLMNTTVPKCYNGFVHDPDKFKMFERFTKAIDGLYSDFKGYIDQASRLTHLKDVHSTGPIETFNKYFRAALIAQLPMDFDGIVYNFFEYSFRIFANTMSHDTEMDDLEMRDEFSCSVCEAELTSGCKCAAILKIFSETNRKLIEMDILGRLCGPTIESLVEDKVESSMKEMCQGMLRSNIHLLENWLESIVLEWLRQIYHADQQSRERILSNFKIKLELFLHETYATIIIDQFFNVIIEYPDSSPAIDDLRICLKKVDLRKYLMETIKRSLENRILHPGVDTGDILTGYVAAIKALRHLDPSGVLLEAIIEPVKDYLRGRQDTVRCVITSLIEDTPSDLAEELAKSEALKADGTGTVDEMLNWDKWEPDPVDAAPQKESMKSDRTADIISMVVDIYGSKELFVNEYKNLLAERLLLNLDLNTEKEIRNLELLKLRFGENVLHSCEVMLKDISDSKRINAHIQCDQAYMDSKDFEIATLILSSQFWPGFKKETLELPERIKQQLDFYTKSYEAHKGNRTLMWRPTNGKVTIEVELENGVCKEYIVTPTQATIIIHFETQKQWALNDLASQMRIAAVILKKKISFWQGQGLIREFEPDQYILVEGSDDIESSTAQLPHAEDDEEADNAMESATDQREEALQVFWSYIVGMLTNLESLPLERIHQMLKMFASHGPGVEFSQQELRSFLQKKVQTQKLVFVAGVYQLPK